MKALRPLRHLGLLAVLALFVMPASSAQGAFGFRPGAEGFDVSITELDGSPALQAGSHPYEMTTRIALQPEGSGPYTDGDLRDLRIELPEGLIENPSALATCNPTRFTTPRSSPFETSLSGESCPAASQVGVVTIGSSRGGDSVRTFGVFNLEPAPGVTSELGFAPYGVPIAFSSHIRPNEGEYGLTLETRNFPQVFDLSSMTMTIWGVPWAVSHNEERGNCLNEEDPSDPWGKCSVGRPSKESPKAYLTLPTECTASPVFKALATSWQQVAPVAAEAELKEGNGNPSALQGCDRLPFDPVVFGQLSDARASSPSGFQFSLSTLEEAFTSPQLRAVSQTRGAVVSLPAGVTVNPSLAAGLQACSPAQLAAETAFSPPGAGCPNGSKIGDFSVQSPLYPEAIGGSIFLAEPDDPSTSAPGAENPFDSLLALYLVAKLPARGILVKVPGELEAQPDSGRLTAIFEDLPQLPYDSLLIHFREGQRAPLVTPAACGGFSGPVELTPWLGSASHFETSFQFHVESGPEGDSCPGSGPAPFSPRAVAGTLNSNAGSYSPFYLHLSRTDSEAEITSYSTQLPPGLLGKIGGIPYCPEAAIAAAERESGADVEAHPPCPDASQIGHTVAGFGVGGVLAYAPGRLYLAGPYHGSTFSIVAIDSARIGPFDLGTIVVRSAIRIDPATAQVSLDSAASDPIPHIREGIPVHLRDLRVYIDRPGFTINPTSCEPMSVTSTLTGSSAPFSDAFGARVNVADHFQVSNCASLDFSPRFSLRLSGGTRRGAYPSLTATLIPRPGDANLASAAVTLPPTLFLAQEHIADVCTIPQFQREACPAGSVYGRAVAVTPLLSEPLQGPVYLRSAPSHNLPDIVADLRGGGVRVEVVGRIDSAPNGGLRGTFETIPDAPVSRFVMTLAGGRKRGILQNGNIPFCAAPQFGAARFIAANGKGVVLHPRVSNSRCGRKTASHKRNGGGK